MKRIACAALTGQIYCGTVTSDGTSFKGAKQDVTSDVLKAMIDKLEFHGGMLVVTQEGKPVASIWLKKVDGTVNGIMRIKETFSNAARFEHCQQYGFPVRNQTPGENRTWYVAPSGFADTPEDAIDRAIENAKALEGQA